MTGLRKALTVWRPHYEQILMQARPPATGGIAVVDHLFEFLRRRTTFRSEGYTHPDRYQQDEIAIRVDRLEGDCDDLNIYCLGGASVLAGVDPALLYANWLPNRKHARHVRLAVRTQRSPAAFTTYDLQSPTKRLVDVKDGDFEPWSPYVIQGQSLR